MLDWTLISSDSHIVEPPNLWTDRMDRGFRGWGPRVVSEPDGDWWMIDGTRGNSFQGGAQVGKRFERPEELRPAARFSEVRPGAYQPAEFLRENEEDGVWGSVIYPTAGLQLYRVPDLALLSACFRAYNDWLVEFCRTAPDRLRGMALINVEDVGEAVRELERVRTLGLAGGMITVAPPEERSYDHPMYEPFWAAAQDLDAPISLHIDTNRPAPHVVAESNRTSRAALLATADYWVRVALGHLGLRYISHLPHSLPVALGVAMSFRYRGEPRVAMAFTGDGATNAGLYHEVLNMAGLYSAPLVIIVENNQYAYSTPARQASKVKSIAGHAAGYGLLTTTVDGNDVEAVHAVAVAAVQRARAGDGPSLIEAFTLRMLGHAVHDGAEYVPRELLAAWEARDPVVGYRRALATAGASAQQLDEIDRRCRMEIEDAVAFAESSPWPDPSTVTRGVYAVAQEPPLT